MYLNQEIQYESDIVHYGVKYRSGRYPYGSGENPFQHDGTEFLNTIRNMRGSINPVTGQRWKDSEIAEVLGMSMNEMRSREQYLNEYRKNESRAAVQSLMDRGITSPSEIAKELGIKNESTVRGIIKQIERGDNRKIANTANALADAVREHDYIDIGPGTSNMLGVTKTKLDAAIQLLVDDGYVVENIHIPQPMNPLEHTTIKVLAPPGTTKADIYREKDAITPVVGRTSDDGGLTFTNMGIRKPTSVDSSRIDILYAEQGGINKDGVIEIRPGIPELSLGESRYAQVRIGVDDKLYLKGMAVYSDSLPPGVDIRFNTNKSEGTPMEKVLKPMKTTTDENGNTVVDWDNPFGSALKTDAGVIVGQRDYVDPKTGEKKLSPVNICREEGDWDKWDKTLASQFLSKQYPTTAKRQLQLAYDQRADEFAEIKALTNPEVKSKLLKEFADQCDSDAVHMKGAMMPRQSTKVILPITSLANNECYAPTYKDGEEVALIRYPHGGTFEIPILSVNNRNREGKNVLGNVGDAIGINKYVADRLSGADFDGDHVVVIPTSGQKIKSSPALKQLEGFSTDMYKLPDGAPKVGPKREGGDGFNTQNEMGRISNLITDMTIKNATFDEIARAVKHSMVVIDAEKHQLDYRASYQINGIDELKRKYQSKDDPTKPAGGASTLLSRATAETRVNHRREVYSTKEMTPEEKAAYDRGERVYRDSGKTYAWSGKEVQQTSTRMKEAKDARELMSSGDGTPIERIYAEHANKLKALANEARREDRSSPSTKVNYQAKEAYKAEVASLDKKINIAMQNKPYERQAQALANAIYTAKCAANPGWDKDDKKKAKIMSLNQARRQTGANKKSVYIDITPREWEAIQSGAISSSKINTILNNTDEKKFKQLATPRGTTALTPAKIARIQHLLAAGNTIADVAAQVGVSTSTVSSYSK